MNPQENMNIAAKNALNQTVKQAQQMQGTLSNVTPKVLDTAEEYVQNAEAALSDAVDSSVSFIKKYPWQLAAIGAGALGIAAFFWARKNK